MSPRGLVLVTGATGYIGGRLVPHLLKAGYLVRVMARDVSRLEGRPWFSQVEVVQRDVTRPHTLATARQGVEVAYYLVRSYSGGRLNPRSYAPAAHSPPSWNRFKEATMPSLTGMVINQGTGKRPSAGNPNKRSP